MRLFSWCFFSLLFTVHVALADTKITQLPLGSAASSSTQSVFPYVDITDNTTKKLKLSDLVNLPAFSSGYTAPFCTALAALPNPCSGSQVAVGIDVHGNAICTTPTGGVTGPSSATDKAIARFDGTTGKLIQNSGAVLDDSGNVGFQGTVVGGQFIDSGVTANTVPYTNSSKQFTSSAVTPTELGYLSGVTSAIQTQLSGKQATLTIGNLSDVGTDGITVGSGTGAVIGSGTTISQHVADATHNGFLASADYVSFSSGAGGLTSWGTFGSTPNSAGASLATGVGTLQPADGTHPGGIALGAQTLGSGAKTVADIVDSGLTASTVPYADSGKKLVSSSVTPTELGYVSGVTSAIQTQFSGKQATGSYITATTGDVTSAGPGSVAATVAQIQGTVVSGTTGSTNVVFSSAPTLSNPVVGTQTTGDNSTKAASTAFVQASLNQLNPAAAAFAASTANIPGTYLNAVGGVCIGDTFTVTATGALSVDGQAPAVGKRVLLKNQTSGFQNGIWDVTVAGTTGVSPVLTRSMDWDSSADMNAGNLIPVINGTANANTVWFQTAAIATCNSDSEVFTQFVGGTTSPLTTKGDLYVYSTTNARLPVGTNNQILTPNSGATTGLNWVTALPTAAVPAFSGDVSNMAGSLTTVIGIGAITPSKLNTITDGVTLDQSGSGSTLEVKTNGVANAQLAQMAAHTYKGNNTGSTANSIDLTRAQVGADLGSFLGGDKNYLSTYIPSSSGTANTGNGNFEFGATTGWSLAHSTITSSAPVSVASAGTAFDSTHGGSGANGNLSLTTVSSSQIQGISSGSLASSTASTAGDLLISSAFNIDLEDQAKVQTFKFYYTAHAGASNLNFSGTSSNSYSVWIYDVTNGAWIQPAGVYSITQSSGNGYATGTFQTTSNSTQYQIALVNINASAGAFTLYIDDFFVGPQTAPSGPAMSDWVSFPMVITGASSNPTKNGSPIVDKAYWRRDGDSVRIRYEYQQSSAGTAGSGDYLFALPSGLTADTSKAGTYTLGAQQSLGAAIAYDGSTVYTGSAQLYDSLHVWIQPTNANGIGSSVVSLGGAVARYGFEAVVPISGWSSNSSMSNDTDTRVVAARYHAGSTTFTTETRLNFATQDYDTHGAVTTGASWVFTAPVSGYYEVTGLFNSAAAPSWVSGNSINVQLNKNGSDVSLLNRLYYSASVSVAADLNFSAQVQLNAGDTIGINGTSSQSVAMSGDANTWIAIKRLTGPAVIAATESVNMKYTGTTTASVSNGANVTLLYKTKVYDSHNAFNPATGLYTIPVSGKYRISGAAYTSSVNVTNTSQASINLIYNGSNSSLMQSFSATGSVTGLLFLMGGSTEVSCNAGDTIGIVYESSLGATATISDSVNGDWIAISRIGN